MKKIVFITICLLIPVLFFFLLEIILRLTGYGDDLKLIRTTTIKNQKFYQLNPEVGRRYFSRMHRDLIPQLYPQTFEYQKSANTFRIFLIGGSTMAGFPYQLNARINSLLKDRLETYYPDRKFEVVNTGLSAINSFSVLDFVDELINYEPDLFIIYMGHNEFYGAYGVSSLEKIGKSPGFIRAYLTLNKFKLFLLLRRTVQSVSHLFFSAAEHNGSRTLMASVAKKKVVPLHSSEYRLAKQYFRDNLERIILKIRKQRTPLLISTIFSNIRDQEPFISLFADKTPTQSRTEWENCFQLGMDAYRAEKFSNALDYFSRCAAIDSIPAKLYFQTAKCQLALNDQVNARLNFQKARDLDGLRFRAPSEFNQIIKNLSSQRQLPIVDLEKIFNANSPHNIVGNELVSEHLHPNFDGYFLMAKFLARAIMEHRWVAQKPASNFQSDNYFYDISGVTIFDRAIGDRVIQKLTSQWPYPKQISIIHYSDQKLKAAIEKSVIDYLLGKISWNQGHYQVADYFENLEDYDRALREYLAVIKVVPENFFPYYKAGNLFFIQNRLAEAEEWFKQALALNDQAFLHAKLGMVYLTQDSVSKAEIKFRKAIEIDSKNQQLSLQEKAQAHYYLAICHAKNQKNDLAKQELRQALALNPSHQSAQKLLTLLKTNTKVHIKL
ncbi:MAG: tetratricopeptide repeat protein [bacterium]|nr:tetratricopeptide repeat protein [bacterium]